MREQHIGPVVLEGPFRARRRLRLRTYFRPGVLLTSALLSALVLTVLARLL
jgi:hypothetical protein